MKQIDVSVLRAVSGGVGPFECSAKFFPDGSLAGPWVHASGVWDWNRQLCEEKAIGRSVRR